VLPSNLVAGTDQVVAAHDPSPDSDHNLHCALRSLRVLVAMSTWATTGSR
jgi:hypothetical protein